MKVWLQNDTEIAIIINNRFTELKETPAQTMEFFIDQLEKINKRIKDYEFEIDTLERLCMTCSISNRWLSEILSKRKSINKKIGDLKIFRLNYRRTIAICKQML